MVTGGVVVVAGGVDVVTGGIVVSGGGSDVVTGGVVAIVVVVVGVAGVVTGGGVVAAIVVTGGVVVSGGGADVVTGAAVVVTGGVVAVVVVAGLSGSPLQEPNMIRMVTQIKTKSRGSTNFIRMYPYMRIIAYIITGLSSMSMIDLFHVF